MATNKTGSLPVRQLNRRDAAIVVGAALLTFGLGWWVLLRSGEVVWLSAIPYPVFPDQRSGYYALREALTIGLIGATVTFSILRLRRPRPKWRHLMRQPGWVAAVSVAIAVVWTIIWEHGGNLLFALTAEPALGGDPILFLRLPLVPISSGHNGALAVAVGWAVQSLGSRWRPERSWLDRTGRFVGLAWLVMPVVVLVGELVSDL